MNMSQHNMNTPLTSRKRQSSMISSSMTPQATTKRVRTVGINTGTKTKTPSTLPTKSSTALIQRQTMTIPKTPRMSRAPSSIYLRQRSVTPSLVRTSTLKQNCRHHTPSSLVAASNNKNNNNNNVDDRFIPSRSAFDLEVCRGVLFASSSHEESTNNKASVEVNQATTTTTSVPSDVTSIQQREYKRCLLSSLCNVPLESLDENARPRNVLKIGMGGGNDSLVFGCRNENHDPRCQRKQVLQHFPSFHNNMKDCDWFNDNNNGGAVMNRRKIRDLPVAIMDCPDLVSDFYLHLISWSRDNILAVALGNAVWIRNCDTGAVGLVVDFDLSYEADDFDTLHVSSISWCPLAGNSHVLAIGISDGSIQLWDASTCRRIHSYSRQCHHYQRIATIAWNESSSWMTTGGRDGCINHFDMRGCSNKPFARFDAAHRNDVCGLKWSHDSKSLASGGNDDVVCIWDAAMMSSSSSSASTTPNNSPRLVFRHHKSAVKAMDWSPFSHRGLLATGGGSTDQTIKLCDTNTGRVVSSTYTGSQVCSLLWSQNNRGELVSAHGFNHNELAVWKFQQDGKDSPNHYNANHFNPLTKLKELLGHNNRVLDLVASPDGCTVASVSGDETIRLWEVFGNPSCKNYRSIFPDFGMPTIR